MRIKGLKTEFYDKLSEDEKFHLEAWLTIIATCLVMVLMILVII